MEAISTISCFLPLLPLLTSAFLIREFPQSDRLYLGYLQDIPEILHQNVAVSHRDWLCPLLSASTAQETLLVTSQRPTLDSCQTTAFLSPSTHLWACDLID